MRRPGGSHNAADFRSHCAIYMYLRLQCRPSAAPAARINHAPVVSRQIYIWTRPFALIPAANQLTDSGRAPDLITGPDRLVLAGSTPRTIRSFLPESCALMNLRLPET